MEKEEIKAFITMFRRARGIDLSSYRENFLFRRLSHRMKLCNLDSLAEYLSRIKKNDEEFNKFLDTLAINVSQFFRDSEVFDYFRKYCLKDIIGRKESGASKTIRIWSAGCAQGQETYSLAIMLKEELVQRKDFFVKIWGTDIDSGILEKAREAKYDLGSLKEVDKRRLDKYFRPLPGGLFQLDAGIKEMARFTRCDLFCEPPLKYVDAIFCRNVMIYFSWKEQDRLFNKFYNTLCSKGYLVIGKVETIRGDLRNKLLPVALSHKIFQKNQEKKIV
ncbi:MAG: protein-glutamate O-methyltransferase CheR [Candidatus Omnitrophica bacterium]|nr:protein-glutamate O-methyltransferase CheR [Candidatus Omnitrophota bacterium]